MIIQDWLKHAHGDSDLVLVILSEVLPHYLEWVKERKAIFSLRGIKDKVSKKIKQAKQRV